MNKLIAILSVILGAPLIWIYIRARTKLNVTPDLRVIVELLLSASGLIGAVTIMIAAFWSPAAAYIGDTTLHTVIAGVALFHASFYACKKTLSSEALTKGVENPPAHSDAVQPVQSFHASIIPQPPDDAAGR